MRLVTKPLLLIAFILLLASSPAGAQPSGGPYDPIDQTYEAPKAAHVYYVAPDGKAVAPGTLAQPLTLDAAIEKVVTGGAGAAADGVVSEVATGRFERQSDAAARAPAGAKKCTIWVPIDYPDYSLREGVLEIKGWPWLSSDRPAAPECRVAYEYQATRDLDNQWWTRSSALVTTLSVMVGLSRSVFCNSRKRRPSLVI